MRRFALILMVLAVPCAFAATALAATQTTNLNVSATMPIGCSVTTTGVNFGNVTYAPDGGSATGDVTVNCTNGLPYNIALDGGMALMGGTRTLIPAAFSVIYYWLYQDAGASIEWGDSDFNNSYSNGSSMGDTGSGANQSHPVYATFIGDDQIPPGNYTDTVIVTVHY